MVKFSFIIAVYGNLVDYNLQHCVDALLKQDFRDFEIIICGNKIIKNNQEIIGNINVKNVVVNTNKLGKLMNEGFKIAEGEYIQFWNPDLVCYSDYLRKLNFYINTYGKDMLYTGRPIDIRSIDTRHNYNEFFYKSYDLADGMGCIHRDHFEPYREEFSGYATHWSQELLYRLWKKLTFICLQDIEIVHLPHAIRSSLEERNNSSILSSRIFEAIKNG